MQLSSIGYAATEGFVGSASPAFGGHMPSSGRDRSTGIGDICSRQENIGGSGNVLCPVGLVEEIGLAASLPASSNQRIGWHNNWPEPSGYGNLWPRWVLSLSVQRELVNGEPTVIEGVEASMKHQPLLRRRRKWQPGAGESTVGGCRGKPFGDPADLGEPLVEQNVGSYESLQEEGAGPGGVRQTHICRRRIG